MTLRVTVTDIETGDSDTAEVPEGDYLLICHDPCRLAKADHEDSGRTHILRIEGRTHAD